ncbi:hypothetical protein PybrP1_006883 [[Pythium] brassicae (nom. inval.)]|nr:hypothetical protein PybrP1_006883 [[Pythium] brassicae (nom. inval.)]
MHKLVFPMRESMPQFVSSLRAVDEWKRIHAKRADVIAQTESKYMKSAFARSLRVEDLQRFLDDTVLDINFMAQLPSIEKCLDQWWELYAKDKETVDQDQLRIVYYDLAFVLVEAKTETIHKNAVSMIMRSSWTKWSPKEPPLSQSEFYRLLFILGHLMTTTNRLGDYVIFFHETMSKIRRHFQSKIARTQVRKRQPKMRRKSSLAEIFRKPTSGQRPLLSSNQIERLSLSSAASIPEGATHVEDETADRFVEILERNTRGQHVVVDPLLHDKRFQDKWKRPGGTDTSLSAQQLVSKQNPPTNKFYPPMFISRLKSDVL